MEQPDFAALRKLLKLKRHELPPPRYFNDFSTQVINGITNGRHLRDGAGMAEPMTGGLAWLERFVSAFQRKPAYAGLFGAAVCGLVLVGIAASDRVPTAPAATHLTGSQPQSAALPQAATVFSHSASALTVSSTNPVIPSSGSLFDSVKLPGTMLINYSTQPPGN